VDGSLDELNVLILKPLPCIRANLYCSKLVVNVYTEMCVALWFAVDAKVAEARESPSSLPPSVSGLILICLLYF
jgi:hypothetical protein